MVKKDSSRINEQKCLIIGLRLNSPKAFQTKENEEKRVSSLCEEVPKTDIQSLDFAWHALISKKQ